jgi:hypothetical protein
MIWHGTVLQETITAADFTFPDIAADVVDSISDFLGVICNSSRAVLFRRNGKR